MNEFKYTPDEEITVHKIGAIRHMCKPFLSHENGLPELVKNSAAAYLREDFPLNDRIILIAFSNAQKAIPACIACLDFVGMTSRQIEQDFKNWADPNAATRSSKKAINLGELGGHGNGGKCYMTQMFADYSLLHTIKGKKGCKYGVKGSTVAFGYVPDPIKGRDFIVSDIQKELSICLKIVRINAIQIPSEVIKVAKKAKGFTFALGVGPKDYEKRIPVKNLVNSLLAHPQMISALQFCKIYIMVNGKPIDNKPLSLPTIDPKPSYEEPRVLKIPEIIRDPISRRKISTTGKGNKTEGEIRIYTSDKNMRLGRGGIRQWRHTLNYITSESGIIGRFPMTSLSVDSSYIDFLYADCYLDSLDGFQQNDRGALAECPLTRAINTWISNQVNEYCREFEKRESQEIRQQDKQELSRINEWLDQWKNQFMNELMQV